MEVTVEEKQEIDDTIEFPVRCGIALKNAAFVEGIDYEVNLEDSKASKGKRQPYFLEIFNAIREKHGLEKALLVASEASKYLKAAGVSKADLPSVINYIERVTRKPNEEAAVKRAEELLTK